MSVRGLPAPSPAVAPASARPAAGPAGDAWRSLDWRFLLGVGRLGRVALVGAYSDGEAAAVEDLADAVHRYGTPDRLSIDEPAYDVIAVRGLPMDHPGRAMAAVRPGGWLHLEVPAGAAAAPLPWRTQQDEATAVRVWHAPSASRRSYLVPLDLPGGVRHALCRYEGAPAGRTRSTAARLLLRAGGRRIVLRDQSLVVRRGGPARDLARSYLDERGAAIPGLSAGAGPEPLAVTYVTPRFPSSRHVLGLLVDGRSGRLRLVAKMPRRPADRRPLEHEAGVLDALRGTGCAPDLVVVDEHEGQPLLLQTAVAGHPLGPARVRRDPSRAIELALRFLDRLPASDPLAPGGWWQRLVADPLAHFASLRPAAAPLVERTLDALAPLRAAALPSVIEHGDLSNPNLLVDGEQLRAVDWELAELAGLPGHDLTFFLQYVASARAGAATVEAECQAFDEAFVAPDGWARAALARHLHERSVATNLLPALVVACWARRSIARLRLADPAQPLAALVPPRDLALWHHAVDRLAGG